MIPTKKERAFFVEHQKFFETLWEPRFGDLVLCWDGDKTEWGKDLWCIIGRYSEDAVDVIRESDGAIGAALIVDCAPILRPDQIREMLEEEGRFLMFNGPYAMQERRYQLTVMAEDLDRLDARIDAFGPTPSIALGKCLLEVVDEQTKATIR